MNKEQFIDILKNPYSNSELDFFNHENYNAAINIHKVEELDRFLDEENWSFLGFSKLEGDLIKRRPWGVFDYAMVFEDERFEKFWIHYDFGGIKLFIDELELPEEEKEYLCSLYPNIEYEEIDDDDYYDIWSSFNMMGNRR